MLDATSLTRRERQILDVVYRRGEVTAALLERELEEAPGNATIRSLLKNLENKGFLRHRKENRCFIYSSAKPMAHVKENAVVHLVKTFFQGSPTRAINAILESSEIQGDELDELSQMIAKAKGEGR